jgi:hypothetical protein
MGAKTGNTYAACMEQHCLRLFVALTAYLGNIIKDGDVVNAYAYAESEGTPIYIFVDDVFKAWFQDRFQTDIPLRSCVRVCKVIPARAPGVPISLTILVRHHYYCVPLSRNPLYTAEMIPLHLVRLS